MEDGIWQHSLELLYSQEVEGKDPLSVLITRYFDSQKKMEEEEINRIQEILKDVLLPCFALTVHS